MGAGGCGGEGEEAGGGDEISAEEGKAEVGMERDGSEEESEELGSDHEAALRVVEVPVRGEDWEGWTEQQGCGTAEEEAEVHPGETGGAVGCSEHGDG